MHMVSGAILDRWTELSDQRVVELVLSGQTALFEILMRRHNERLARAARAIVLDEREAEDVVQAWVNAYAHLRQFEAARRWQAQPCSRSDLFVSDVLTAWADPRVRIRD